MNRKIQPKDTLVSNLLASIIFFGMWGLFIGKFGSMERSPDSPPDWFMVTFMAILSGMVGGIFNGVAVLCCGLLAGVIKGQYRNAMGTSAKMAMIAMILFSFGCSGLFHNSPPTTNTPNWIIGGIIGLTIGTLVGAITGAATWIIAGKK